MVKRGAASTASAAHGQNSLNSISTTSSLLGGGAAGDASASVVLAGSNTIVVAAKGIGSVAAVAGGSWLSRAANGADFATGVMVNGALDRCASRARHRTRRGNRR